LSPRNGEFAPYIQFADGAAVDDVSRFGSTGDEVGLQDFRPQGRLENGATIPADLRFAYKGVYYSFSLGGPCPNVPDAQKGGQGAYHQDCMRYVTGPSMNKVIAGVDCQHGHLELGYLPDGSQGCAVILEDIETVMLDEVAGIYRQDCGGRACRNWADFRVNCTDPSLMFEHEGSVYCREFDVAEGCEDSCLSSECDGQNDIGIPFWLGRCNATENENRAAAIVQLVSDKYAVDMHYATNPRCSRLDSCSTPIPEEGSAYCHRDASGVCDSCFVPGTVNPPRSRSPDLQQCRIDLFKGTLPQYESQLPVCASQCGKTCSDTTEADLCCLYIGDCTTDWQVGDWTECSAECGLGEQTRPVICPFEELAGPCSDSTRPDSVRECHQRTC